MRTDQKGYSLVEVIIVVAILGILVSLSVVSINVLTSGNLKSATTKINTTMENVRIQDMSYTNKPAMYFYQDSDGKYRMFVSSDASVTVTSQEAKDAETFGSLKLTLTYEDSTGNEQKISDLTGRLYPVQFNSNNGALLKTTLSGGDAYLTKITISKGNGELSKTVSIVPSTGKHSAY